MMLMHSLYIFLSCARLFSVSVSLLYFDVVVIFLLLLFFCDYVRSNFYWQISWVMFNIYKYMYFFVFLLSFWLAPQRTNFRLARFFFFLFIVTQFFYCPHWPFLAFSQEKPKDTCHDTFKLSKSIWLLIFRRKKLYLSFWVTQNDYDGFSLNYIIFTSFTIKNKLKKFFSSFLFVSYLFILVINGNFYYSTLQFVVN